MPLTQFIISTIITIDSVDREHAWGRAAKPRETRAEARRKDLLNLPLICIFFLTLPALGSEKKRTTARGLLLLLLLLLLLEVVVVVVVVHISHTRDILV